MKTTYSKDTTFIKILIKSQKSIINPRVANSVNNLFKNTFMKTYKLERPSYEKQNDAVFYI